MKGLVGTKTSKLMFLIMHFTLYDPSESTGVPIKKRQAYLGKTIISRYKCFLLRYRDNSSTISIKRSE